MKLSEKLDRLRRLAPNGPTENGQLYKNESETRRRYTRVVMHTLFISEENTHLLRPHIFKKEPAKTPEEWREWFAANLESVHMHGVLPGIGIRTGKHWSVQRIIGWVGDAKHSARNSTPSSRRHKTKRQGRSRGQNHIRGR